MSIVLDGNVAEAKREREKVQTAGAIEAARNAIHGERRDPSFHDPEAKPEGIVGKASDLEQVSAPMVVLCKEIADYLVTTYPGWLWGVNPQEFGGMVNILNLTLHPVWGYRIKVSAIQNDLHNLAEAKRGAGEILERFGMPRGPFTDRCRELIAAQRRDLRGNLIPDTSDKDRNLTHAQRVQRDIEIGRLTPYTVRGRTFMRRNW